MNDKPPSFAKPSEWEREAQSVWDDLTEIADRQGARAAAVAAKQARYAVRTFIEEKGGNPPMTKIIKGRQVEYRPQPRDTRTTAEITRDIEKVKRETAEMVARTQAVLASVKPTTTTTAATEDPTAQVERLTRERMASERLDYGQAWARVVADHPDLYARHCANVVTRRTSTPLAGAVQASEPKAGPAQVLLDQLAKEHAEQHRVSYATALAKIAAERPDLYTQYTREVTP